MINTILLEKFKVLKKIGEGGISEIFLARTQNDKQPFVVKILKQQLISDRIEDIIRFNNEAALISSLDHEHIVKIYHVDQIQKKHFIVMEYIDGENLAQKLNNGYKYSVTEALSIIEQLCKALAYIHQNGIIHRDLKPSNIMLQNSEDENVQYVKIIDFGLAQIKEFDKITDQDEIIGTFSYMSPEQCGVINQPVDERSDLYSLGIIFYQLLTGIVPFTGKSVSEIIHKHIASKPPSLKKYNHRVHKLIERVIFKLIEKEPNNRYQSARGVLKDLERFNEGYSDFALGEYDKVVKINFRTSVVGRTNEVNLLNSKLMSSLKNNGGMCLIRGETGSGKTRLGQEVQAQVYNYDGFVLSSKCFKAMSNTPYGPFRDATNIYIRHFAKKNEWEQNEIRNKLKEIIGDLGKIIIEFNPAMETILGACPEIVELEADRENQRFLMVMTALFRFIAQTETCLLFQIDNMQWIDEGSISLLLEIMHDIHNMPLLMIATINDEDITEQHVVNKLVNHCSDHGYPLYEINLGLFGIDNMRLFISGLLYQKVEDIKEIAEFIQSKSNGNPFFAEEILRQMVDENAIEYKDNKWILNHDVLKTIEISASLIDIIIKRISLLTPCEKKLLSYAAVIGKTIEIDILLNMKLEDSGACDLLTESKTDAERQFSELNQEQIVAIVDKAVRMQFLENDQLEKSTFLFTHNRVWEAFSSLIDKSRKKQLHNDIACAIETIKANDEESVLFDLAYHALKAEDSIRILKYASQAARIAKNNYANDEALLYYKLVMSHLEKLSGNEIKVDKKYLNRWLYCLEEICEIYLRIGEIDDAIQFYGELLTFKKDTLEQAIINRQICYAYFKKGDWINCEKYGNYGLKLLREKLPISNTMVYTKLIKEFIIHLLYSVFPKKYYMKTRKKHIEKNRNIILIYVVTNWMYILSDINKFIVSILRMLNLSQSKLGRSKELAMSIGSFASMLMAIPFFKRSFRYHYRAITLRNELNDDWGLGQSLQWLGYAFSWSGDLVTSNQKFNDSLAIFRRIGDLWEIGMVLGGLSYNYYLMSDYYNSLYSSREYQRICKQLSDHYGLARSYLNIAFCLLEKGEIGNAEEYAFDGLHISKQYDIKFNICYGYILLGYINAEKNEYDEAVHYFMKARDMDSQENFIKTYIVEIYPYMAEVYINKLQTGDIDKAGKTVISKKQLKQLCKDSLRKTKPWPCQYGLALRVNAMFCSYVLKNKKAETYFNQAIELFSRVGRKFEQAKTLLEYSRFLFKNNREDLAKNKIKSAMTIFREIGAQRYIDKITQMIGIAVENEGPVSSKVMVSNRLTTMIAVSQNLSSILNIDDLLDRIMSKSIEVTGAQRGYLFIKNSMGELELKVSKDTFTGNSIEYSKNIVESVFKSGEKIIATNAEKDLILSEHKSVVWYGLKSVLCVPIMHHDNISGICYLDNPLSSGVFTEEDSTILSVFMSQAGIAIDNAYLYQNLENEVNERTKELHMVNEELSKTYNSMNEAFTIMKEDLALARKLQFRLLPQTDNISDKLIFNIRYYPMSEVGGDIYDIIKINDNYIRIFIADATGHGVQAALITMIIRSEYDKLKNVGEDPSFTLKKLNNTICNYYKKMNMIFSCMVLDIDLINNSIKYSSAGHPAQYLITNNTVHMLESKGRIIGLMPDYIYNMNTVVFQPEDKLVLITDGICEEFDDRGIPFGDERIREIIRINTRKSIDEIIDSLFDGLNEFVKYRKKMNENDDITVLGIQYS